MFDRKFIQRMSKTLIDMRIELFDRLQLNEETWLELEEQHAEFEGNPANERVKARIAGLDDRIFEELRLVQKALQKIETDRYGRCEVCGREIGKERLEAMPAAERCLSCASTSRPMFGGDPEDVA